jgi:hypothetical protein
VTRRPTAAAVAVTLLAVLAMVALAGLLTRNEDCDQRLIDGRPTVAGCRP